MMSTPVRHPARAALALSIALAAACTGGGDDPAQSIEGQVARGNFDSKVLGVRAVGGSGEVVARAPVTENGHFRLAVPVGQNYRLEVVTAAGAHPFVRKSGASGRNLVFDVCSAGAAYDVGHVHGWAESDGGGTCSDPCMEDPTMCDPCQIDPESCQDPCRTDPESCQPPCDDPAGCPDPCMIDPDSCQDPCAEDPSLCEPSCDDQGNCCYKSG